MLSEAVKCVSTITIELFQSQIAEYPLISQLNQLFKILWYVQTAFTDALVGKCFQLALQFIRILVFKIARKRVGDFLNIVTSLMHELQSKMKYARLHPILHLAGRNLCLGIEDRVAAADIGHDWMPPAMRISKSDFMLFTWVPTIGVVGSVRQKATKNAMFGVKNRQMMERDNFDVMSIEALSQFRDLLSVQIVGWSHSRQPHFEVSLKCFAVSSIQTEIAMQFRQLKLRIITKIGNKVVKQPAAAYKYLAIQRQQKPNDFLFARF